ncbi:protein HAIKU1-like [Brassica napus]|uniref:protein HAIKU1-like n=1 Tax=Brassica napus TaxID=3708 RepID=UPI002078834B|nr:protein HAIKU1-like [Brassica napus]
MDRPRHNDQLAVKMTGKKIKKETPLHLPNGYTSKNRLRRSIVPPLTSSPKIRPAALINRPHDVPPPPPAMTQPTRNVARPPMMGHADQFWSNIAVESPLSVSLPSARFSGGGILPTPVSLCIPSPQSSFGDSGPNRNQMKPSRFNGSTSSVPILPSPTFDGPGILPTPPTSFTSSSMPQAGILGPGKFPRPPHASTALVFSPLPFGENTS